MADVTDRAQLILVTALIIAVTLVTLMLLLNTVIFTDNLASRGTDSGGRDAVAFQKMVVEDVGKLVDEENREDHGSHDAVAENVTDGLEDLDTIQRHRYVESGSFAEINVSSLSLSNGTLVRQTNSTRQFSNESDEGDWIIAENVTDTRGFSLTIENSSLVSTNASQVSTEGAFSVNITSSSREWRAYVYENATNSEFAVAIDDGAGPAEVCSVERSEALVDLTAGTLDGERCPELDWTDSVTDDYDIAFDHGNNATGRYELTVNTSGAASVNEASLNDGTSVQDSPYHVPAIYSASIDIRLQNADLRYEATIRIASGEPT